MRLTLRARPGFERIRERFSGRVAAAGGLARGRAAPPTPGLARPTARAVPPWWRLPVCALWHCAFGIATPAGVRPARAGAGRRGAAGALAGTAPETGVVPSPDTIDARMAGAGLFGNWPALARRLRRHAGRAGQDHAHPGVRAITARLSPRHRRNWL
jgi:hypothetical protein